MNININYHGKGTPIVFFHGWGFDHQVWLPLIPHLKNNYQLILVDLPGFGLTPMMDWDVFKPNLLSQLPAKFALAGWSMGGLYATRLAIEAPNRVNSLINITSSPRFITEGSWPGVDKAVFLNFHKNLASDPQSTLKDFVTLQLGKNVNNVNLGTLPSVEGLKSGLHLLDTWDLREGIKSITQPTCYMFGRLDPITPVKTMQAMQILYPDFNYIFFNKSAHMPFLSHTDLFVTELMEFIK